jgi:protein ImuB
VPLITAMQDGDQRVIASVDEAARRLKLRPGVTIAHAQSLVPGLHIHDAMPREDDAALARLALWCTRRSAGLFIDIASSAHLFRGETALLQDLKNRTVA